MKPGILALLTSATALTCLLTMGCSSSSYVSRTATLPVRPPKAVVASAIRAVPAVQSLDYTEVPARSSWSLTTGTVNEPAYDQFVYLGAAARGDVEIRQNEKGEWLVRLNRVWLNAAPSPLEVRETIALMDKVYDSLYRHLPEMPKANPAQLRGHGIPVN